MALPANLDGAESEGGEFCPSCGGGRILEGFLGDPPFRCCRDCGSTWRVSEDQPAW